MAGSKKNGIFQRFFPKENRSPKGNVIYTMEENNKYIEIVGARVNNLKNISLRIASNRLVVITGLSGSGKSSLAFDTLFAEGQRRYVESLSAYARQFLGRIEKPEVDKISGISPAIAVEQRVSSRNPRSTVGTTTEIYDYLKLLFARAGETFSPISGKKVLRHTVASITDTILERKNAVSVLLLAEIPVAKGKLIEKLVELIGDGYDRLYMDEKGIVSIPDFMSEAESHTGASVRVVVEKIRLPFEGDTTNLSGSVEQAVQMGDGAMWLVFETATGSLDEQRMSTRLEADGMVFDPPFEQLFGFNNPIGACPRCEGSGRVEGIDEDLVVPDKSRSVYDEAIMPWRSETMRWWRQQLIDAAQESGFPIHKPYFELTESQKEMLWKGSSRFKGIDDFFAWVEKERYKIQYKVMLSRYTGKRVCPLCGGGRLKKEASYVKVGGYCITDLVKIPVGRLLPLFDTLVLSQEQQQVSKRILTEIQNRLRYLCEVGLDYLTLDRLSSSLSGGESQRINLSTSLGSSLVGSMYILDEPSIGLHPRDTKRLIGVLKQLRDLGNTVIVVEHEEEMMRQADEIIDIGPKAGSGGGEVVFQGNISEMGKAKHSLTADYLFGRKKVEREGKSRQWTRSITVRGARENNLKNIDVEIPLEVITCITGVSGSGKSSLVKDILAPALNRYLNDGVKTTANYDGLSGDLQSIYGIEMVDQNPIGRSSRSNPVTYIKAYDEIRKLYSAQPFAKTMNFSPSAFSFNIAGGRCESCQGEGIIRVEMQFMADVVMKCEECGGRRFKDDVLQVQYRGKSISDVLEMSVTEAIAFFSEDKSSAVCKKIVEKLRVLERVGLDYVKLGQSSSTLSGGESQRVKLAYFLLKENAPKPLFFIFDEPTTGLHFHDIKKLLASMNALVDNGHTVVIVEHNLDVIRCADWVIDLGPEGGEAGGSLVFEGRVADLIGCKKSYTGKFLKDFLDCKK